MYINTRDTEICNILLFLLRVHFKDLTVYVGMHDRLDDKHLKYAVVNGVKHQKFTSNAVRDINDIAVLTLEHRMTFSDKIAPICLPDKGTLSL